MDAGEHRGKIEPIVDQRLVAHDVVKCRKLDIHISIVVIINVTAP
jgi:hypothetical protein